MCTWHLNPSNGLSRGHECDRQTDHATEKCVGIGGIACAARTIPPKIWCRSCVAFVRMCRPNADDAFINVAATRRQNVNDAPAAEVRCDQTDCAGGTRHRTPPLRHATVGLHVVRYTRNKSKDTSTTARSVAVFHSRKRFALHEKIRTAVA